MSAGRLHYLTNLRTALTALVVIHHAAIAYGGEGVWPYHSPSARHEENLILIAFNVINQTFFMAAFFFLSGYLSEFSARRKPIASFRRDKALRLAVPVLVYTLSAGFIEQILLQTFLVREEWRPIHVLLLEQLQNIRGVQGPVWYCALLFSFDTVASVFWQRDSVPKEQVSKDESDADGTGPDTPLFKSGRSLTAVILASAIASFFIRIRFPISDSGIVTLLNLRLGFIPQYFTYYILGVACGTWNAEPAAVLSPPRSREILLAVTVMAILAGLVCSAYREIDVSEMRGGWNLLALCYAIINETVGCLLLSTLLSLFQSSQRLSASWGQVGQYAYAAFLVHVLALVAIQAALDTWDADGVFKTAVVGLLGVVASWVAGWLLVQAVPGARRVIA